MEKFENKFYDGLEESEWMKYIKLPGELVKTLAMEYIITKIIPKPEIVFQTFKLCEPKNVKVVIIGQDCYMKECEAMGMAFSVPEGVKIPPSLRNIFGAIESSYGKKRIKTDLSDWNSQGVLLLNSALTIREGNKLSHMNHWVEYTDGLIKKIADLEQPKVFCLWGNFAKAKKKLISKHNLVLEFSHPSPLSRIDFKKCDHFVKANEFLEKKGIEPIKWV